MRAESQIELLSALVHPRDGHKKVYAMLEGYFDESGIHDGAPICIVAGYYADHSQWNRFEKRWKPILDKNHIDEFHAKEFFGPHLAGSKYHGWSSTKCKMFLDKLLRTIDESRLHAMGSAVVISDWKDLSLERRKFFTGAEWNPSKGRFISTGCPSKPYFTPFQECIGTVAKHCSYGEVAHFFFDMNKQFSGYANDLYRLMKSYPLAYQRHLGVLSLPTGKEAVQLQAADLICYLFKDFIPQRIANPKFRVPPLLGRAIRHARTKRDFPLYNAAEFRRQLTMVKPATPWSLPDV